MATQAEEIRGIGHRVRRKEDDRFIRGKGSYLDDFKLPFPRMKRSSSLRRTRCPIPRISSACVAMPASYALAAADAVGAAIAFPAAWIAFTMFTYPVHRQMLPEIAHRTSSSEGVGFLSSNALATSIMPGVQ